MRYRKVLLLLILFSNISCSSYRYYDVNDPYARHTITGGYFTHELYSIEPEIQCAQYPEGKYAIFKNNVFYKKRSNLIDYLRTLQLDTNMSYYAFSLFYSLTDNELWINKIKNHQNITIFIDSIFVQFIRSNYSYQLTDFYREQKTYTYYEQPNKYGIQISPIEIPKDYMSDFEISLYLQILFEDGTILTDTNLVIPVEYKEKTRNFLNPWP